MRQQQQQPHRGGVGAVGSPLPWSGSLSHSQQIDSSRAAVGEAANRCKAGELERERDMISLLLSYISCEAPWDGQAEKKPLACSHGPPRKFACAIHLRKRIVPRSGIPILAQLVTRAKHAVAGCSFLWEHLMLLTSRQ